MTLGEVTDTIRGFFEESMLLEFNDTLTPTTNLFKNGHVDSFGFIELVTFIEQTFNVEVPDEALLGGALSSLDSAVKCVHSLLERNNA